MKQRAVKRGSITLYLCLTLSVLLSLLFAAYRSARICAGRVVVSSALEQGMFSVFGEYDRDLFARYGLLFIDGGRGSSSLRLGIISSSVEEYAKHITSPGKVSGFAGRLTSLAEPEARIEGYTLASDMDAAAFRRQICAAAKEKLVMDSAEAIRENLLSEKGISDDQRNRLSGSDTDEADSAYNEMKSGNVQMQEGGEMLPMTDTGEFSAEEAAAAEAMDLGEDYGDPVETVRRARSMGILQLAVPAGRTVSASAVEKGVLPSERSLQRGMGVAAGIEKGLADKALLIEYAARMFPSFCSEETGSGLRYQTEYLIGGKRSDADNLKAVLTRLCLIREGSNFVFLSTDPEKRSETLAAAMAVCAVFLAPYLAPAVASGIRAAWAYAESIMDLRTLLDGGRVPLIKTADTWQLSVRSLPHFTEEEGGAENGRGLDYLQYLRMLLLTVGEKKLTERMMDMVEHTIRTEDGRPEFRIDSCIDAMTVRLISSAGGTAIEETEHYGYGM